MGDLDSSTPNWPLFLKMFDQRMTAFENSMTLLREDGKLAAERAERTMEKLCETYDRRLGAHDERLDTVERGVAEAATITRNIRWVGATILVAVIAVVISGISQWFHIDIGSHLTGTH